VAELPIGIILIVTDIIILQLFAEKEDAVNAEQPLPGKILLAEKNMKSIVGMVSRDVVSVVLSQGLLIVCVGRVL
jgi:hypothetical protein